MKCTIDNCERALKLKGICQYHYNKINRAEYMKAYIDSGKQNAAVTRYRTSHKGKVAKKAYESTLKGRFSRGKVGAIQRKIPWEITLDEYSTVANLPCHYCTRPLNATGSGLDRKDNNYGYNINNILPCCSECNFIRGEELSVAEAEVAIAAVMKFRGEK